MSQTEPVLALVAVLLLLSVAASKLTRRFGVPMLLLFIGIGMLAGSEGVGGVEFTDFEVAQAVGVTALAIILFSGGLDTDARRVRPVDRAGAVVGDSGRRSHVRDRRLGRARRTRRPVGDRTARRRGRVVDRRCRGVLGPAVAVDRSSGRSSPHAGTRERKQRPDGGLPHDRPPDAHHRTRHIDRRPALAVRPPDAPRRRAGTGSRDALPS